MTSLRLTLLSFTTLGLAAAVPGFALAQEAPPVSDPAAGQRAPILVPAQPGQSDPARLPPAVVAPAQGEPAAEPEDAEPEDGEPASDEAPLPPPAAPAIIPIPTVWAPAPVDREGHTAYGLYLGGRNLVGRSAVGDGEAALGARYLAEVQSLTPEQPTVRQQAFTAALLAGDLSAAARMAPSGEGVPAVLSEAGRLVRAIDLYAHGKARDATAVFKAGPIQMPHAAAGLMTQRWIAAAAGDWDFALIGPPQTANDTFSQVLRFQRAQLLELHRRYDEAEAEYKLLAANPAAQPPFHQGYGAFLERRGRKAEAAAVYDAALTANPDSLLLQAAKERVSARRSRAPAAPTYSDGVAQGLTLAASLAADNRANEFAAVYLRMALEVAPSDDIRLLLGGALVSAKLEAAARDAMAVIGPRNAAVYAAARLQIGASLGRDDRKDEALAEFRKAFAAAPDSQDIAYALATQLLELKRNDEALEILNGPLLNTPDQPAAVHFVRGAAYEASGKIAEAEAELSAAVADQPNEPAFLNYLGYLWVDNGTRVAEGAALIARAHAAEPNDGNIQDSLGWAQFRQGQYDTAVTTLEEAVDKEPANAEINDHLGDAYWQVGRKREAGFQWNRVLTLNPDAERRAEVEKKLAEGLPPQTPVAPPVAVTVPASVGAEP
ncbi:tetratricopeptide repeat protein [Brevundimonas goettingensis]|uniref:Tetratricopeptide repeat protein n=1 Tax=Brevundimonas goettingensis TaxID=2774190 RepID=A0A975C392_9CAUL|nr:tetratricopeptide repeat protein [Brevundimonas goettingensis]QTC91654.1 tetratricopeptide repeat protein [Brevundimonas goettingensis]